MFVATPAHILFIMRQTKTKAQNVQGTSNATVTHQHQTLLGFLQENTDTNAFMLMHALDVAILQLFKYKDFDQAPEMAAELNRLRFFLTLDVTTHYDNVIDNLQEEIETIENKILRLTDKQISHARKS